MRFSLHANIYYLYLIKLSKWFMLFMPVVALFYTENGLDEFDIYLLQAVYSISVAFLEIPSGYMADIIGRRTSLIIGSILGTLGFVVLSMSHSLPGFLAAAVRALETHGTSPARFPASSRLRPLRPSPPSPAPSTLSARCWAGASPPPAKA